MAVDAPSAEGDGGASGGGASTQAPALPAVIDDLVPRVLHCCCEDTWQV